MTPAPPVQEGKRLRLALVVALTSGFLSATHGVGSAAPVSPLPVRPIWDIEVDDATRRIFISGNREVGTGDLMVVYDFDGTKLKTFSMPSAREMVIHAGTLYVAAMDEEGDRFLQPISLGTLQLGAPLPVPSAVGNLASAGGRIWFQFPCNFSSELASIEPQTGEVVSYPELRVGCEGLGSTPTVPDRLVAWGEDMGSTVWVVDVAVDPPTVESGDPGVGGLRAAVLSPDGETLFAAVADGVIEIDVASMDPGTLRPTANPPIDLSFIPTGGGYVVATLAHPGPDVAVLGLHAPGMSFNLAGQDEPLAVAAAADGKRLFVVGEDQESFDTYLLVHHGPESEESTIFSWMRKYYAKSGKYHLYHEGDLPRYKAKVVPNHAGHLVYVELQVKGKTKWKRVASDQFALNAKSAIKILIGSPPPGRNFRIQTVFKTDGDHPSATSAWRYFKVKG